MPSEAEKSVISCVLIYLIEGAKVLTTIVSRNRNTTIRRSAFGVREDVLSDTRGGLHQSIAVCS